MQKIQGKGAKYAYYCKSCDTTFRSLEIAEEKHQSCKPKSKPKHDKKEGKKASNSSTDAGLNK